MKQDKETRNKLLQSAREEFVEKGYMNASLRNICRKAGVTTGALYFFFKDKDDLFESLTKDTIDVIFLIMQGHFQMEKELMEKGTLAEPMSGVGGADYEDSKRIIHQMYLRRDDILLVLTKSQGSSLEHIEDKFIEAVEAQYRVMAQGMQQVYPDKVPDDNFIHWLAHMQIDAFIYMITHIEEEDEALNFIRQAVTYMVKGWYGLYASKD